MKKVKSISIFRYAFQDLKRQKIRTIFSVMGVLISIMLLTVVGSLSDSMSFSYLDQATTKQGSSDITISKELFGTSISSDPYFDQDIIQNQLQGNIEEIEFYFPRIMTLMKISYYNATIEKNIQKTIFFYGTNNTNEYNAGSMGHLWICGDVTTNFEPTEEEYTRNVPVGSCVITRSAAKLFGIRSAGESISLDYINKGVNLTIDAIVDQDKKFAFYEVTQVLTDLPWAQSFLDQEGKVNTVLTTLKDREQIYDTRDVEGTTETLRLIGEKIQNELGLEFIITMPKMQELESAGQDMMSLNTMFGFLTFFSMLITSILINSILTTNIEERVKEFGLLRVLGGKRKFNMKIVLATGFSIAAIGSILGTAVGAIAAPKLLQWYFNTFELWAFEMEFIVLPQTVLTSLLIGIGITSVVSIFPALKAGKGTLSEIINPNPNRAADDYSIEKESSVSSKLILFGIGISAIGVFLFTVFPTILATGDMAIISSIFVFLLMMVLIGLVFMTVGVIPVLQNLIAKIIKPFIRRFYPIYDMGLKRYRRRNISTTIMFSLSFAFIFFVSTTLTMRSANSRATIEFQHGSDLVVSNTGSSANDSINIEFFNELSNVQGIQSIAPSFHNSLDLSLAFGAILDISEGGLEIDEGINFDSLFGSVDKLDTYAGDIGSYNNFYCNMIGLNESYLSAINSQLLMWEPGSSIDSLNEVFNSNDKCIISKSLSDGLGLGVGEMMRLTTYNDSVDDIPGNITQLKIVGVSRGLPGFFNMRSSKMGLYQAPGVMVNMNEYSEIMNWGDSAASNTIVDKIFINLRDDDPEAIKEVQTYINNYFGEDYSFQVNEAVSLMNFMEDSNNTTSSVLQVVLFFSIIISLFGLITTMYSTLIERMFEIGILRAMGLKSYEVRQLMISESLTIMFSAGGMGALIGIFLAYLLQTNSAIITEMPVIVALDVVTLLSTFVVSIVISVLGMILITKKIKNWSIVDIIRSTFA